MNFNKTLEGNWYEENFLKKDLCKVALQPNLKENIFLATKNIQSPRLYNYQKKYINKSINNQLSYFDRLKYFDKNETLDKNITYREIQKYNMNRSKQTSVFITNHDLLNSTKDKLTTTYNLSYKAHDIYYKKNKSIPPRKRILLQESIQEIKNSNIKSKSNAIIPLKFNTSHYNSQYKNAIPQNKDIPLSNYVDDIPITLYTSLNNSISEGKTIGPNFNKNNFFTYDKYM